MSTYWDVPGGTVADSSAGAPGSIPAQGTRPHMLQLGAHMLHPKTLHGTAKTRHRQTNTCYLNAHLFARFCVEGFT